MRKVIIILLTLLMLLGCSSGSTEESRAMQLRSRLMGSSGCSFDATVTADYGEKTYTFAMGCQFDAHGNLSFVIQEPQTIEGIAGTVDASGGKLTFDGSALAFPLLADGQASPISAPWLLYKALVGGYLKFYTTEKALLHLTIDDSYRDDAMQLDIWLSSDNLPLRGEILYENRRILTITIENFTIL